MIRPMSNSRAASERRAVPELSPFSSHAHLSLSPNTSLSSRPLFPSSASCLPSPLPLFTHPIPPLPIWEKNVFLLSTPSLLPNPNFPSLRAASFLLLPPHLCPSLCLAVMVYSGECVQGSFTFLHFSFHLITLLCHPN